MRKYICIIFKNKLIILRTCVSTSHTYVCLSLKTCIFIQSHFNLLFKMGDPVVWRSSHVSDPPLQQQLTDDSADKLWLKGSLAKRYITYLMQLFTCWERHGTFKSRNLFNRRNKMESAVCSREQMHSNFPNLFKTATFPMIPSAHPQETWGAQNIVTPLTIC